MRVESVYQEKIKSLETEVALLRNTIKTVGGGEIMHKVNGTMGINFKYLELGKELELA